MIAQPSRPLSRLAARSSSRIRRLPVALRIAILCSLVSWAVACSSGSGGNVEEDSVALDVPSDVGSDTAVEPDVVEPEGPPIGAACSDAGGECADGICAGLLPNGYCTVACDVAACPAGTVCQTINDFPFCLQACTQSDQCRRDEGYACLEGACNLGCKTVFDCETDQQCVVGECVDPVPDRIVGAMCTSSKQCLSGYCLGEADGGVCSEPCTGAGCSLPDWSCHGLVPIGGDQPLNLCGPGSVFATDELELTGPNPYSFTVSTDVRSFLIVVEGGHPESFLYIENLRRPDGSLAAGPLNAQYYTEPFRIFPEQGHASVVFPYNEDPAFQVVPGKWQFDVGTAYGTARRVRVFLKRSGGAGDITQGTFDLNVFIALGAVNGLSAATAANHATLKSALARVKTQYWADHGLTMGDVRYFDIPGDYVIVNDMAELNQMFASQSTAGANGALNLFLVRDIQLGQAIGIAGGVPGPVGVQGTGGSGVAFALQGSASELGDGFTHELGHFISFYHVTEVQGEFNDVIGDTKNCANTPENLLNGGSYDSCMENVMFPVLLTGWVQQKMSNTQGRIARLNPRTR